MRLTIDSDARTLTCEGPDGEESLDLYGTRAFELLSRQWLRVGWGCRYSYRNTWLGRPIIQLPEDMVLMQEVIFDVRPDLILETGVAHGGSLVFYASLCKALEQGRLIGVDIEIRPDNRKAIEDHPLSAYIRLIEGDSTDPEVVEQVKKAILPNEKVMVLLDSCHSRDHVLAELRAYAPLVSVGSYIVVMDSIMAHLAGVPGSGSDWTWNNPMGAANEFLENNPDFEVSEPGFAFNEGTSAERVTYSPRGFLRRIR